MAATKVKAKRKCDERTPEERALDFVKDQLRSIPLVKAKQHRRLQRLEVKTGIPRNQSEPGVLAVELAEVVRSRMAELGWTHAEVAWALAQRSDDLAESSAQRALHRVLNGGSDERPLVGLKRADELLLAVGLNLNRDADLAVLPPPSKNFTSALNQARAYYECREMTVSTRRVQRTARRLMRFSAGYIVGRLDLDEQQLHDVEPRPAADPEVEDAVAS